MKTIVFIFVPSAHIGDLFRRVDDLLAGVPDSVGEEMKPPKNKRWKPNSYPLWTRFLSNPLGDRKQ